MSRSQRDGASRKSPIERAAQIDAAARELALDSGLYAVTLRGVASRIGVASGLIAHYAGTMDALVASTFGSIVAAEIADVQQFLSTRPAPASRLVALVDTLLDRSRDDVTVIWVEAWAIGRRNAALALVVRQQMDAWRVIVSDVITEGIATDVFRAVDSEAVAGQLLGMIDGLNAHALVSWNERDAGSPHIRNALEGMLGSGTTFALAAAPAELKQTQ